MEIDFLVQVTTSRDYCHRQSLPTNPGRVIITWYKSQINEEKIGSCQ